MNNATLSLWVFWRLPDDGIIKSTLTALLLSLGVLTKIRFTQYIAIEDATCDEAVCWSLRFSVTRGGRSCIKVGHLPSIVTVNSVGVPPMKYLPMHATCLGCGASAMKASIGLPVAQHTLEG